MLNFLASFFNRNILRGGFAILIGRFLAKEKNEIANFCTYDNSDSDASVKKDKLKRFVKSETFKNFAYNWKEASYYNGDFKIYSFPENYDVCFKLKF